MPKTWPGIISSKPMTWSSASTPTIIVAKKSPWPTLTPRRLAGGDFPVHLRDDRPDPPGGVPAGQSRPRLRGPGIGAEDQHRHHPPNPCPHRRIAPAGDRRTGVAHPRSKPGNLMAVGFSFSPTGSASIICLHGSIRAAPGRSSKPAAPHTGSSTPATPDRQAKAPGARPMSTDEAQRCADQGSLCLPPHPQTKAGRAAARFIPDGQEVLVETPVGARGEIVQRRRRQCP